MRFYNWPMKFKKNAASVECILGTKKPDTGSVTILGMHPLADRKRMFQKVGVQFQEAACQQEIKVYERCEELACIYKETADWRLLLKQFGIGSKE